MFGVQKTRTSPYHPRGDGMVERHNRTLQDILSKLVSHQQDDWDELLPLAAMAYRSAPHESTGETPNILNFGREITLPVDLLVEPPPGEEDPTMLPPVVLQVQERLREVSQTARQHLHHSMVSQKRQYDKNVRLVQYKVGDIVWLYHPATRKGTTHKFARLWKGPFKITHMINEVNYRIQATPRSRPQIVHADRLKPCLGYTLDDLGFGTGAATDTPLPEAAPFVEEDAVSTDSLESGVPEPQVPSASHTTRAGRPVRRPRIFDDYIVDF